MIRIYGRVGRGVGWSAPLRVPWVVIAVLLGSFCPARHAHGQVPSTVRIVRGNATTVIRNPGREPLAVAIELRSRLIVNGAVVVGGAVRAVCSPSAFTLAPGAEQVVRLRLKEVVPPGTVLGFVVTFTPLEDQRPAPGAETAAVARITLVTRVVGKAVVQ